MNWSLLYHILFYTGILLILTSLFLSIPLFFILISMGYILILYSLFEHYPLNNLLYSPAIHIPATIPSTTPQVTPPFTPPLTNKAYTQPQQQRSPLSFFKRFAKKKPKKPDVTAQQPPTTTPNKPAPAAAPRRAFSFAIPFKKKQPITPSPQPHIDTSITTTPSQKPKEPHPLLQPQPAQPEDIAVIKQPPTDHKEVKLNLLKQYIKDALNKHYPFATIREAAQKSNWPHTLFEKILTEEIAKRKKKKLIILLSVLVVITVIIAILYGTGLFLLPYWIESLQYASPTFYISAFSVIILIILIFILKIRKLLKTKNVEYHVEEEKHVEEIKQQITQYSTEYETDLDKLYNIIADKKRATISEIAKAFNVTKKQAEEWGKILKEQNLLDIYYPTVGETELVWKSSKNTE